MQKGLGAKAQTTEGRLQCGQIVDSQRKMAERTQRLGSGLKAGNGALPHNYQTIIPEKRRGGSIQPLKTGAKEQALHLST